MSRKRSSYDTQEGTDVSVLRYDASIVNGGSQRFSDFMMAQAANNENPELAAYPSRQTGKAITFNSFIDWAVKHPLVVENYIIKWQVSNAGWVSEYFPFVSTQSMNVIQHFWDADQTIPEIMSRNTPGRIISIKFRSTAVGFRYMGQSFEVDYSHMQTDDGMMYFDLYMDQIHANIMATSIFSILKKFESVPPKIREPNQKYAFAYEPMTPEQVFELEPTLYAPLCKRANAINGIAAKANAMFDRIGEVADAVICDQSSLSLIFRDPSKKYYEDFGPKSLAARKSSKVDTLVNLRILPVPNIQVEEFNNTDKTLFRSRDRTWSFIEFKENTIGLKEGEYFSRHRNVSRCTWKTNGWFDFSLANVIASCPNFYQNDTRLKGKIHRTRGWKMTQRQTSDRLFQYTRTEDSDSNRQQLDLFITYQNDFGKTGAMKWRPVVCFGELAEETTSAINFRHTHETMKWAALNDMSKDDRLALKKILNDKGSTFAQKADDGLVKKFYHSLKRCVTEKGNALLNPRINSIAEFLELACGGNLASITSKHVLEASGTAEAHASIKPKDDVVGEWYDDIQRLFTKNETIFAAHEKYYPLDTNANFMRSWNRLKKTDIVSAVVGRVLILQEIDVDCIRKFHNMNIAIPFGAMYINFAEQMMHGLVFLSKGTLGNTYMSKPQRFLAFNQDEQQFKISQALSHGSDIQYPSRFLPLPNIRGGTILGGKGTRAMTNHPDINIDTPDSYDTLEYKFDLGAAAFGDYSNIPVLQSLNSACSPTNLRYGDVTGKYSAHNFLGKLRYTPEFTVTNEEFMYSGVAYTMHTFQFWRMALYNKERNEHDADPEELTFAYQAVANIHNTNMQAASSKIFRKHYTDYKTKGYGPWGDEEPGLTQKQQSLGNLYA